jgi:hypothetical protein
MSDKIISMTQNADGSFDFGYLFDGGNGLAGETSVRLPAPIDTPAVLDADGITVITPAVAAVPYTAATARAASLPIAAAQKASWLTSVNAEVVIGVVTLPN